MQPGRNNETVAIATKTQQGWVVGADGERFSPMDQEHPSYTERDNVLVVLFTQDGTLSQLMYGDALSRMIDMSDCLDEQIVSMWVPSCDGRAMIPVTQATEPSWTNPGALRFAGYDLVASDGRIVGYVTLTDH